MPFTLAIVGRPNVGKSSLFNRIAGRRIAIVHDTPGVTRDRRTADVVFDEMELRLIDTAGFEDAAPESFSSVASALTATAETTSPDPVGAVYVSSNKYGGNEIVSFLRFADGSLKTGPRVLTGGLGSGPGQLIPNDPLGNQALSLRFSRDSPPLGARRA